MYKKLIQELINKDKEVIDRNNILKVYKTKNFQKTID